MKKSDLKKIVKEVIQELEFEPAGIDREGPNDFTDLIKPPKTDDAKKRQDKPSVKDLNKEKVKTEKGKGPSRPIGALKNLIKEVLMEDKEQVNEQMSKNVFVAFAYGIKGLKDKIPSPGETVSLYDVVTMCVEIFKRSNPRFDPVKFREACGPL